MGFQLSFGLVAVLIRFGTPFHLRLWGMRIKGPRMTEPTLASAAAEGLKRLVSTNLLCCLAAMPIVMYHTGLISPAAVLTGIVVVPIITGVLIAGYVVVLIGVLAPPLVGAAAGVLALLAGWTSWLVRWIDEAPWTSVWVPALSLAWAVFATGVFLYWIARGHRRDWPGLAALGVALVWLAGEIWLGTALPREVALRIDTLAVGDGTCHLVRSGRAALLWDCGSLRPGVGRMLVPRAVRELGALRVPTVVITHPNLDHFNGVLDVVEPLGVERVLIGEAFAQHAAQHPFSGEAVLLTGLARRGVAVRIVTAGQRITEGPMTFEFLSPPAGADWPRDNDMSLVARVSAPGAGTALFCGDIQDEAILRLHGGALHPAVMEAPHHGSARDAAIAFVAAADPGVVLQSTGPGRVGDARWGPVRAARRWWCTAVDGACWVELRRDGGVRSGAFAR